MKLGNILRAVIIVLLLGIFGFSAFKFYDYDKQNKDLQELYSSLSQYSPKLGVALPKNDNIIALQKKYPDIDGWIMIPNTNIDYPFVAPKDDNKYLRMDLNGKYQIAGTLFLDHRCKSDLTTYNNIIYGHNMRTASMFGSLTWFTEKDTFDKITTGYLYLSDVTYEIQIFACAVVQSTDAIAYNIEARTTFVEYLREKSLQFRELDFQLGDTYLTLSTCSYAFDGARTILVGRLIRM